ncbi:MAG TPA: alternative ribosome rescue aminoacyl-tRNA hydrolase ArfB [Phycisphaerales bacterium]|nr:alternative ribosome rescue aminoacyl-tRNA hydrolase ArfB [Phycisphaerales bacterium]HMP37405.1 alternative ribosome rescue aminoacyl-tRNA hydrolase ArfB [Phycisphaerales bacterium]
MSAEGPPRDAAPRERPATAIDLGGGAWIARGDLRWAFSRSSGPGGQNVNKVNTRAELRVDPQAIGGLDPGAAGRLRQLARARLVADGSMSFVADETRSQLDNRAACIERLRALVAQAIVVPRRRRKTRPSRGSVERRIAGKKRDAQRKRDRGWRGEA